MAKSMTRVESRSSQRRMSGANRLPLFLRKHIPHTLGLCAEPFGVVVSFGAISQPRTGPFLFLRE
ncbi:hypothetical protein [Desulfobacter hydrogenophilus]|uniref:Uncharacterized protein n=1 Tax=Desulfobacter hydrogenophilus TaxID=2291 RepID=A0ABX5RH84_9BACT|nr:hypothetical protein [Desulfobacter hydrogenophilus]NDY73963.1 hypothetical protein [Desulfobacter hydrogenophilus]QBH14310.1 hypothetical protein EYB58_16135 [Desulfobacter hydrogenophilus]